VFLVVNQLDSAKPTRHQPRKSSVFNAILHTASQGGGGGLIIAKLAKLRL
jgi:hypothetical protein